MFLLGFPLLLIPFALYNIIAFLMPGLSFAEAMMAVELPSGARLPVSAGDLLAIFALFVLYVEILKTTRLGRRSFVDHLLALVLFAAMVVELALVPQAATATFLLLVALGLIDVISGFSVAGRGRRHVAFDGIERAG
jgi:hypothetical protein